MNKIGFSWFFWTDKLDTIFDCNIFADNVDGDLNVGHCNQRSCPCRRCWQHISSVCSMIFFRVVFYDISGAGSWVWGSSRNTLLHRDNLRWRHVHHRRCRDLFGQQKRFSFRTILRRTDVYHQCSQDVCWLALALKFFLEFALISLASTNKGHPLLVLVISWVLEEHNIVDFWLVSYFKTRSFKLFQCHWCWGPDIFQILINSLVQTIDSKIKFKHQIFSNDPIFIF